MMPEFNEGESSGEKQTEWVSLDDLQEVLEKTFSTTVAQVQINKVREYKKAHRCEEPELGVSEKTADELLGEVARRVLGFSLTDLNASELREIEEIRKDLGFSEEFNPSA